MPVPSACLSDLVNRRHTLGEQQGHPEQILQLCTHRLPVQAVWGPCGDLCGTGQGTPSSRQAARPGQQSTSQISASTSVSCRVKDSASEQETRSLWATGSPSGMLTQADQGASQAKAQERSGRGAGVRGGGLSPMRRRACPSPSAGEHQCFLCFWIISTV